jgi:hypothetical protein
LLYFNKGIFMQTEKVLPLYIAAHASNWGDTLFECVAKADVLAGF